MTNSDRRRRRTIAALRVLSAGARLIPGEGGVVASSLLSGLTAALRVRDPAEVLGVLKELGETPSRRVDLDAVADDYHRRED